MKELSSNTFAICSLKAMYATAFANGAISGAEAREIEEQIDNNVICESITLDVISDLQLEVFHAITGGARRDEFLSDLEAVRANHKQADLIMKMCVAVAKADAEFSEDEESILIQIADLIDVNISEFL